MRRRTTSIDFSLSFLDLLLSGVGGVSILVILFAALGKEPPRPQPIVSRMLMVEITDPSAKCLLGEEIGFQLNAPGSTESPIADDYSSGWATSPGTKKSLAVPFDDGETPPLELRLFLKTLAPGKLADPEYAKILTRGVEYRLTWSTELHNPLVVADRITVASGFHRVIRIDQANVRANGVGPPPWFDASLLPLPPPQRLSIRSSGFNAIGVDWANDNRVGFLIPKNTVVRATQLATVDPFVQSQLQHLRTNPALQLGPNDSIAIGPRGVSVVVTTKGETHFYPRPATATNPDFTLVTRALGTPTALSTVKLREYARRSLPASRIADADLDQRLADALATGLVATGPNSAVTKQDPLLWPFLDNVTPLPKGP